MKNLLHSLLAAIFLCLYGCGLFDSGTLWQHDKYELGWIDDGSRVCLDYRISEEGTTTLIPEQVYSVGYDDHYVVAKQHPNENQEITYYYYVIIDDDIYYHQQDYIFGPFTKVEFEKKKNELHLPDFSFTLDCYDHGD